MRYMGVRGEGLGVRYVGVRREGLGEVCGCEG